MVALSAGLSPQDNCSVSVTLSPSNVSPHSPVTAIITVSCQNSKPAGTIALNMALHGSGVPGISLCVKDVRSENNTSSASCTFNAPLGVGQYDIIARYIDARGYTITGSSVLTIA